MNQQTKRSGIQRGALTLVAAALAGGLFGGCESGVSDDDIELATVVSLRAKQADLKDNPQAVLLLDSRSPAAFRVRHIPGAMNFTLAQVPTSKTTQDGRLLGYDSIIIYGQHPGDDSARGLTKRLMGLEYDEVYWFKGGLDEWTMSGGPTEGTGVAK